MAKNTTKTAKEVTEEAGPTSSDVLAGFMNEHKEDHFNDIVPEGRIISTGSLLLDQHVKIRSGCVVRFSGLGAELGKSSEGLVLLTNYMSTMPKSKSIYVKAEGRLSEEIRVRSGCKFVDNAKDWEYGTIFVLSCNKFERIAELIEKQLACMHEKEEHLGIMVDSLDGLQLVGDAEKAIWHGKDSPKVAGVQLLTKLLFRRVALPIVHYDALMVITSQFSTAISLDPYAPQGPRQVSGGGGSAAMHQSDYVFELGQRYNGDYILEDENAKPDSKTNKIIGVWASYQIKKSGTDVSGIKIKVPIRKGRVGSAIWVEKEVVDMVMQWSFLTRKGAWFTFDAGVTASAKEDGIHLKEKIQGMASVYEYFETDHAVFEWFYAKCKKMTELS